MKRHFWPLLLAVLFVVGCGADERGKHKEDPDRPRPAPPPKKDAR